MYAATLGCKVCTFWVHVCGSGWVQSMRLLGAKYMDTFGCMYADVGCTYMERLGACMRLLGAKSAEVGCMYMETFGCMYAEAVGCKVCGCWVQSIWRLLGACMRLLGASLKRLIACLTVGGYTLHVYPLAWAQGPPGAPGPNNLNNQSINRTFPW